ncbi:sugar/nucleoside kinase (ribokinase family) [Brachybacterium sacelli]|uniref:Sugar/nucleoside kinase (Ribokinase family) n=1 Tax=Brachybacterium sacelli TaxID=173364 RepID=A0ABS4X6L5_9MICO|nr:sugar/nucleoside kinase (ribokinase family) [Brachybacterium sacelli]
MIHTGQGVVDLVMRIPEMPGLGGDVFATGHQFLPGGGVNVMVAAARDGAEVLYVGGHGTGPFGDLVREALRAEGVALLAPIDPDTDTGFSVALVEDSTERTFVSTTGAEAHGSADQLHRAAAVPGDVVYVSGYSLVHEQNRRALLDWLPTLPAQCQVVVDPAPVIGEVGLEDIEVLLQRADVWTTNDREAWILLERLTLEAMPQDGPESLAAALCARTSRQIVMRAGSDGAYLARPGEPVLAVPAPAVDAVDTNGAGDAHAGVMCARLAAGEGLLGAARRAGVAAALAVTRHGPATAPTAAETDASMRGAPRPGGM